MPIKLCWLQSKRIGAICEPYWFDVSLSVWIMISLKVLLILFYLKMIKLDTQLSWFSIPSSSETFFIQKCWAFSQLGCLYHKGNSVSVHMSLSILPEQHHFKFIIGLWFLWLSATATYCLSGQTLTVSPMLSSYSSHLPSFTHFLAPLSLGVS